MKQIPDFPNYFITKDGRVWSNRFNRWLKPNKLKKGYLVVTLMVDKKPRICRIHRLLLETYIGPCPDGMECRHLDGNPANNDLDNLKWGTRSENVQDSVRHGTHGWLGCNRRYSCLESRLSTSEKEMIFYAHHYNTCTIQELADAYYVTQQTILKIAHEYKPKAVAV